MHMPVTKDSLKRYRIIDRLLSDPNHNYTTEEIMRNVNRECNEEHKVTLRMIQKDIKALEEDFGKKMIRNAGKRGVVKYEDQSEPLFYKELTDDEEEVLREALKTFGQFEGLDNFTWLDLLKKKLDVSNDHSKTPLISFGVNDILQIHRTLLGELFTAISSKKVIRIRYTPFGEETNTYDVYPYQLRQYNNRWFLLLNTVGNKEFPYNPEFITNFALDRMEPEIEYLMDEPYIPASVDIDSRFDEIVGVTLLDGIEVERIYYAVSPKSSDYVRTKWIHVTQMELEEDELEEYRNKYPSLKDWSFFSIECRPNPELYSLFFSYGDNLVVLEPDVIRDNMADRLAKAGKKYSELNY